MSVLLLTKARELAKKCNDERQVHGSSDVGAEPAILGAADGPVLGR